MARKDGFGGWKSDQAIRRYRTKQTNNNKFKHVTFCLAVHSLNPSLRRVYVIIVILLSVVLLVPRRGYTAEAFEKRAEVKFSIVGQQIPRYTPASASNVREADR
jgi:hypothetical protein